MYCTNFNFLHEAAKKTASFMICFSLSVILLKTFKVINFSTNNLKDFYYLILTLFKY